MDDRNLPKRKATRLVRYDYSSAGLYFLTVCTKEKEKLLGEIVGDGAHDVPRVELSEYGKTVEKYILSTEKIQGIHVEKYVIMPNHIHLLLAVDADSGTSRAPSPTGENPTDAQAAARQNQSIPHAISTFKRFCGIEIGKNIFQRSYHDHVIRGQKDFEKIWSYIDDNPRRWQDDCFYVK